MVAYAIIDLDVHDQAGFEEYQKSVPTFVAKHGGRFVVRGGEFEVLEGNWKPHRLVLLRFPDRASIRAFLTDPEFETLTKLRRKTTDTTIVAVDGIV
jgi:uncharacterized protein (DUF1330 family)